MSFVCGFGYGYPLIFILAIIPYTWMWNNPLCWKCAGFLRRLLLLSQIPLFMIYISTDVTIIHVWYNTCDSFFLVSLNWEFVNCKLCVVWVYYLLKLIFFYPWIGKLFVPWVYYLLKLIFFPPHKYMWCVLLSLNWEIEIVSALGLFFIETDIFSSP